MAVLPTDYTNSRVPSGSTAELPATGARGLNAITGQINSNTDDIAQNTSDIATHTTQIATKGTYSKPVGGIPSSDLTSAVQTSLVKADSATQGGYVKPGTGIPSSDLTSAVQTSLVKADTATQGGYVKPGTGIPSSDLTSAVQTSLVKADTATQGGYVKPGTGIPSSDMTTAVQASLAKADASIQGVGGAYYVDSYSGADPTGATFSDTAVASAITAMGTGRGNIVFGKGTYKLASTKTLAYASQGIQGQGLGTTDIIYTGTGDCFRVSGQAAANTLAGPITGFRLHAETNANTNIRGLHIGDLYGIHIQDVKIHGFKTTGSKGFWGENVAFWSERAFINMSVEDCTDCYTFEKNASHPSGHSSWDYGWFFLSYVINASQNGIVVKTNTDMAGVHMVVVGNTSSGTPNTGSVLTVGTTSTDESYINGHLELYTENQGSGTLHKDVNVGLAANIQASGNRTFGAAYVAGTISGRCVWPSMTGPAVTKATAGANLVYDGSFTDANRLFDLSLGSDGGGATLAFSNEQVHSASQALKMVTSTATASNFDSFVLSTHNTGGDKAGAATAQMKVQGGQLFYFEIYARQKNTNTNSAGQLKLYFLCSDSTGALGVAFVNAATPNQSTISNSGWTQVGGVIAIPAGYDRAHPEVLLTGHTVASQTWYFDDARIVDVSYPIASWVAAAPANATSTGIKGQMFADASNFYVCYATNSWRRVAISSF